MKVRMFVFIIISFLLISCQKPTVLKVKVAESFSGTIKLKPCIKGSKEPVLIDLQGIGETEICPAGDLEIVVIKGNQVIQIPAKDIEIEKAGDNAPVNIIARVP